MRFIFFFSGKETVLFVNTAVSVAIGQVLHQLTRLFEGGDLQIFFSDIEPRLLYKFDLGLNFIWKFVEFVRLFSSITDY